MSIFDINNGGNSIPNKCIDISKKFIRAIDKYGMNVNFLILKESEPKNQYELLYGQADPDVSNDLLIKVLVILNPSDDVYKDMHLNERGDAIISFMTYSMQLVGIINNSLIDYLSVPRLLLGNHVRVGNDYYRIDEVKQTDIFMGFPLCQNLTLTFIENKIPTTISSSDIYNGNAESNVENIIHDNPSVDYYEKDITDFGGN